MARVLTTLILFIISAPFYTTLAIEKPQNRPSNIPCINPPRDSCAFYADCLESRYHCGPNGYPIGYGEKFCQEFSVGRNNLSAKGRTWMLDVMQCLQKDLVPEATGAAAGTTCDSLQKKAFASHPTCYVDSGLCWLPPSDWLAIVDIVGIETLIGSVDAFVQSLKAVEGCVEAYLFFLDKLIHHRS